MRVIVASVLALFAAIAQVTVSPLFPLGGAIADLGLMTLLAIALLASPTAAMFALPVLAVSLGFASDRSPGLLILAYLPLLPLSYLQEETNVPIPRWARVYLAVLLTGAWARGMLATGAFLQGAEVPPVALVKEVLLPGMALDAVFATLLYVPLRLAGLATRSFTLRRDGWELA